LFEEEEKKKVKSSVAGRKKGAERRCPKDVGKIGGKESLTRSPLPTLRGMHLLEGESPIGRAKPKRVPASLDAAREGCDPPLCTGKGDDH